MKLILDVDEVQDYGIATQAALMVMQQSPNQEVGNKGTIPLLMQGRTFAVTRNQDSYTVEVRK